MNMSSEMTISMYPDEGNITQRTQLDGNTARAASPLLFSLHSSCAPVRNSCPALSSEKSDGVSEGVSVDALADLSESVFKHARWMRGTGNGSQTHHKRGVIHDHEIRDSGIVMQA